jgi:hypothetical protein
VTKQVKASNQRSSKESLEGICVSRRIRVHRLNSKAYNKLKLDTKVHAANICTASARESPFQGFKFSLAVLITPRRPIRVFIMMQYSTSKSLCLVSASGMMSNVIELLTNYPTSLSHVHYGTSLLQFLGMPTCVSLVVFTRSVLPLT